MTIYTVRQHIPQFFGGFEPETVDDVAENDLLNPEAIHWLKRFIHEGFVEFYTQPYVDDVLIISARYDDGKSWVAATAKPKESKQ